MSTHQTNGHTTRRTRKSNGRTAQPHARNEPEVSEDHDFPDDYLVELTKTNPVLREDIITWARSPEVMTHLTAFKTNELDVPARYRRLQKRLGIDNGRWLSEIQNLALQAFDLNLDQQPADSRERQLHRLIGYIRSISDDSDIPGVEKRRRNAKDDQLRCRVVVELLFKAVIDLERDPTNGWFARALRAHAPATAASGVQGAPALPNDPTEQAALQPLTSSAAMSAIAGSSKDNSAAKRRRNTNNSSSSVEHQKKKRQPSLPGLARYGSQSTDDGHENPDEDLISTDDDHATGDTAGPQIVDDDDNDQIADEGLKNSRSEGEQAGDSEPQCEESAASPAASQKGVDDEPSTALAQANAADPAIQKKPSRKTMQAQIDEQNHQLAELRGKLHEETTARKKAERELYKLRQHVKAWLPAAEGLMKVVARFPKEGDSQNTE